MVQIDPEGAECVRALVAPLKQEDDPLADRALACLDLLGSRATDAVPVLAALLAREPKVASIGLQVSAAETLHRIDPNSTIAIPALIRALKYRGDEISDSVPEDAARILGLLGASARSAVPALIGAVETREEDDRNSAVREAAALALGEIGPGAKGAIPALHNLMQEQEKRFGIASAEVVIALYQLDPGGEAIAEKWLDRPLIGSEQGSVLIEIEPRAQVLGALGRSSIEADVVTRRCLDHIAMVLFETSDPRTSAVDRLEWIFDRMARLGVGARLAIPRLNELRNYPNPWVRMWANEALAKIKPGARANGQ
jgi:HEAT repeat protein